MKRLLTRFAVFIGLLAAGTPASAQSVANYTTAYNTGVAFNSISTTGTSFAGFRNGTSTDDNLSGATNIGFPFVYNGNYYTQVSVSTNGYLTFNTGTTAVGSGTGAYGYENTTFSTTTVATLAPFYDDQQTAGNLATLADLSNSLKYLTTGTAPNRVFTAEWINMQDFSSTSTSNFNYQVRLFEADGHIEFNYGTFQFSNTATPPTISYSLGINAATISVPPTAAQLLTLQTANTNTFGSTPANALSTIPAANSQYTFTPPSAPVAAPTSIAFSNTGASFTTLTFTDNSTNEVAFIVLRSTDGINYTVGSRVVSTTTAGTGTTYSVTLTGLTPSALNYFQVIAVSEGIGSSPLSGTQATSAPISYTWIPTSGAADFRVASNWSPARITPDPSDTLNFTNGGTPQADSIPAQTVAALNIGNNTALSTTTATATTLTIGRQYNLQAGSSHTLVGLLGQTIAFSATGAPQTGIIAGTLNLRVTGTAVSAFTATNSLTTVTGTVNLDSNGAAFNGTTTNTTVAASGIYTHNRNGGTIPALNYNAASNLNVTGIRTTAATITGTVKYGNLTWNSPNQTVANTLLSTVDSILGNFTIISTGTGSIEGGSGPDMQIVGALNLQGGTLALSNSTGGLFEMLGPTNLTGGTFRFTSSTTSAATGIARIRGTFTQGAGNTITNGGTVSGTPRIEFFGTAAQTATFNGTISGDVDIAVNNPGGVSLATNFPVNTNAQAIITQGLFSGPGSLVYASTLTGLQYNGTTPQTPTSFEFPVTGGPATLVINNAAGVTLPFARTVDSLVLTSGRLFTSASNLLTLTRTAGAGNANSYVIGPLGYLVNSATNLNRTFPIGDVNGYRPLTLNAFNTAGTAQTVTAEVIAGNSGGSGSGLTLNPARFFRITGLSNLTFGATSSVSLAYGGDDIVSPLASAVVAQSTAPNGTYTSLGQGTNTSSAVVSPATASTLTATGGEYFVIANTASTVKFWDGGAGTGNWGDAANWNNDVLPSCTDTVVISIGGPLTVTLSPNSLSQVLTLANGVTLNAPAGTVLSVGCATPQGGNKTLTMLSGSTMNLTAGTVNVYGPAVFNSGSTFNQSGGLMLLDGNDNTTAGTTGVTSGSLLQFNSGAIINATAGTIRIVDPLPISNTAGYVITASVPTTSVSYFTGTHTIELGDGVSTAIGNANGFRLYNFPGSGYAPFNNVVVNGGSGFGRWMSNNTSAINGTLTVNAGSSVRTPTTLFVGRDLINNGMVSSTSILGLGSIQAAGYTVTNNSSIGGSGIYRNTIPTATITAGGAGYTVGDVVTLSGGTSTTPATFVVTAVNATTGAITTAVVFNMGDYTVAPTGANAVTGGTGTTAATFTLGTGTGALIPTANLTSLSMNITAPGVGAINRPLSMSGTLTMTNGLLNTTSTNLLTLITGASVTGAKDISFVTGPVAKTGTTAFTFPVGKTPTGYQPIAIGTPSAATTFTAEYIRSSARALGPITSTSIVTISGCEYWTLDRATGSTAIANVTLNFDTASSCDVSGPAGYITNLADLRVVHFNGSSWDTSSIATNTTTSGTTIIGSVTWAGVSVFSPFTIGSVSTANPLPIKLTSISAVNEGAHNRVTWASAQENAGLRYELERSADGRSFSTIETREGSGDGTSYLHYDTKPLAGTNYYRIRAVDASGATVVSKVVTAYVSNGKAFALQAFPNPVGNVLTVVAGGKIEGAASVVLTDATGKVLRTQAVDQAQITINMSGLPAGLYIVRYTDGARTETVKVTKQ